MRNRDGLQGDLSGRGRGLIAWAGRVVGRRRLRAREIGLGFAVIALLSLGAGIAVAATRHAARSSGPARPRASHLYVSIQATYASANPALVANFSPNGGLARPRWSICPPPNVDVCTPVRSHSQFLIPGRTQAGTVFEATAVYRGRTYTARTVAWLGTIHATGLPTVTGSARYGSVVAPHPGTWAGGWKTERHPSRASAGQDAGQAPNVNQLNIEACRTRTAEHCVNLTPQGKEATFSRRDPRIGQWFTGWYIFAFDQLEAGDTAYAGVGYGNAASMPIDRPGPTVSHSAAHGPIRGPQPPALRIRTHLTARHGRIQIATVRCRLRCHVTAEAEGKAAGSTAQTSLVGHATVSVPLDHLTPGPVKLTLYVGDGPAVHHTSRLH